MESADFPQHLVLKRAALTVAAILVSVNIWTGAPLLAVWVGSRTAPSSGLSMGSIGIVVAVLAVVVFLLATVLTRLNAAYDHLTGRNVGVRRVSPWLRSMRDERKAMSAERVAVSPIERVVVLSVVAAVLTFEVWFFFFAHYSIPGA